ncbi:DUF58 domain-containing protein [Lewinellaceae bacterium SD302]|nr:DUF58 domain-containing protein [Lewinellaceae bacterium SD302]
MSKQITQRGILSWPERIRTGWNRLYLTNRFFIGLLAIGLLSALTYAYPSLFFIPATLLTTFLGTVAFDGWQLFGRRLRIGAVRRLPKVLSLGDESIIRIRLANLSKQELKVVVIDELPFQLQKRDLEITTELQPAQRREVSYLIRPTERGAYRFGDVNVFISTVLGLVERRLIIDQEAELPVYPSIVQMKAFAAAADTSVAAAGSRKLRRLGKSYEFDQIKNYVRGDDYRLINWRATGRRNELMVNIYEDERAQQIYCLIDKSRSMHMPFAGLSLLDYAINASLALSNVVLRKDDRAGLITYSDKIGSVVRADGKSTQLQKILQTLYREKAREVEANPELLYYASRKFISSRSLLLLFSNFSSSYALERALPVLRRINTSHLLVVILFENTEIRQETFGEANNIEAVYHQSTARNFIYEKKMLAQQLRQYGIQVILTKPEDLTGEVIEKYLELKRRAMI